MNGILTFVESGAVFWQPATREFQLSSVLCALCYALYALALCARSMRSLYALALCARSVRSMHAHTGSFF